MRMKDFVNSCFTLRTGTLIVGYVGVIQSVLFTILAGIGFIFISRLFPHKIDVEDLVETTRNAVQNCTDETNSKGAEDFIFFELTRGFNDFTGSYTEAKHTVIKLGVFTGSISIIYFTKNLTSYLALLFGVYKRKPYEIKKWIAFNLVYLGLQLVMDVYIWITASREGKGFEVIELVVGIVLLVWNIGGWFVVLAYYYTEKNKSEDMFAAPESGRDSRIVLVESDDESKTNK